jgi:hypothetical protein
LEIFAEFVACQESTPSPKTISDKEMEINFTGFMYFLSGFHFQKYCWFFTLYINLKNHVSILGIHILYLKVTIVSKKISGKRYSRSCLWNTCSVRLSISFKRTKPLCTLHIILHTWKFPATWLTTIWSSCIYVKVLIHLLQLTSSFRTLFSFETGITEPCFSFCLHN